MYVPVFSIYQACVAFLYEHEGALLERSHTIDFTAEDDPAAVFAVQRWVTSRHATGIFGPVAGVKLYRVVIGPVDAKGNLFNPGNRVVLDWKRDRGSYDSRYADLKF